MLAPAPAEWSMQLEPRSMTEVVKLGTLMFQARLFSAWGTTQAVIAIIMAGRELGMPSQRALRAFDNLDGKPRMKADLIRALMISSPKIKFFRVTERTNESCTFEGQRADRDDPPISLTFTIKDGERQWKGTPEAWAKSGWAKTPADMLVANCGSRLARLLAPDVVHGLYAPEELES